MCGPRHSWLQSEARAGTRPVSTWGLGLSCALGRPGTQVGCWATTDLIVPARLGRALLCWDSLWGSGAGALTGPGSGDQNTGSCTRGHVGWQSTLFWESLMGRAGLASPHLLLSAPPWLWVTHYHIVTASA